MKTTRVIATIFNDFCVFISHLRTVQYALAHILLPQFVHINPFYLREASQQITALVHRSSPTCTRHLLYLSFVTR